MNGAEKLHCYWERYGGGERGPHVGSELLLIINYYLFSRNSIAHIDTPSVTVPIS